MHPDNIIWDRLEMPFLERWQLADSHEEQYYPYEIIFQILREGSVKQHYKIDPNESWVYASMERNIPIFVPGWEDSSLGNMYAGACMRGAIKTFSPCGAE